MDESLVVCKYSYSDKQASDGRYIHILNVNNIKPIYKVFIPKPESKPMKADAEMCHAVYTALLSNLELTPAHGYALLEERGLSDTTVTYNLYASVPNEAKGNELARTLAESFNLKGVPGFYKEDGGWRFVTTVKGFYVPYRDERGRIVGLQIRRNGNPKDKYLWLTSTDKVEGASPGSPLHFVKPEIARQTGAVIITEGALKADRIGDFTDEAVVALAGVSVVPPDKLLAALREAFPKLQKAIIAFDMDWKEKPEVKEALMRLLRRLKDEGLNTNVRTWNISLGKGLDDALYRAGGVAA
jgi:DNA primase